MPEPKVEEKKSGKSYRVLIGAVSGWGHDPRGQKVPKDFHKGSLVTAESLGAVDGSNFVDHYVKQGWIEEA